MIKDELFTRDNTKGYTQDELDFHNLECKKYLMERDIDIDIIDFDGWIGGRLRDMRDKYFSEFMC